MDRFAIPGYRIEGPLGEGGMAVVYRAVQLALERPVALKVLRPELALETEQLVRFAREGRTLAALAHPNVLQVYDCGTHGSLAYHAMELCEEPTLYARMEQRRYPYGRFSVHVTLAIAADLLAGLGACHEQGLVHRDVKPSNIFAHRQRGAILGDFGLVKELAATNLTGAGETVGTVAYMAPEQAAGLAVGPAADLYAVGVVLYELIAGHLPFDAATPAAVMRMHQEAALPSLASRAPKTPAGVVELVHTALAKEAERRFASAAAMRRVVLAELEKRRGDPGFETLSAAFAPGALPAIELADVASLEAPTGASLVAVPAAPVPVRAAPAGPAHAGAEARPAPRVRPGVPRAAVALASLLAAGALAWTLAPRRTAAPPAPTAAPVRSSPSPAPDPRAEARAVAEHAARLDLAPARRAMQAFRAVSWKMKPAHREAAQRALEPIRRELAQLAKRLVPVSRAIFEGDAVSRTIRLKVYDVLVFADHLERFGVRTGLALATGLAAADRGPYASARAATLPEPGAIPLPVAPGAFIAVDVEGLDISFFSKQRNVELTANVAQVERIERAELVLVANRLTLDLDFEVLVNATAPIAIPGRGLERDVAFAVHAHRLDPGLLVEGVNRFALTLRQVPGLLSLEAPSVRKLELRVVRR